MPRGRAVLIGVLVALVSIVLTALAFLFVLPAGILPRLGGQPQPGRGPGEAREVQFDPNDRLQVIVALQDLPRGFRIPDNAYNNAVGVREWPAAAVPVDAILVEAGQDPEQVVRDQIVGNFMWTDVAREQPMLRRYLVDDLSQLARQGSVVGAQLPSETRAVAIPVDKLSSVSYLVQPGDRVDVVLSFLVVDVDEEFQSALPNWVFQTQYGTFTEEGARITALVTPTEGAALGRIDTIPPGELANIVPSEPQRPRLVTQKVISCALVMQVGVPTPEAEIIDGERTGEPAQATPQPLPDVVTLAVSPQEVNVVRWAVVAQVDIALSICSVEEGQTAPTSAVTLQYMFETYNVPPPPRLPYSLEPALRGLPEQAP